MQRTLAQLDEELDRFKATLEAKFAANADAAGVDADVEEPLKAHVQERLSCMLGSLGLIPSNNEGEPCD